MHVWFTIIAILIATIAYISEKYSVELVSITLMAVLILFFSLFPLNDSHGQDLLSATQFFKGFANSALITVMCMIILGQAVSLSGALKTIDYYFSKKHSFLAITLLLIIVCCISTFMNNTPVVVMFIPIISALAKKAEVPNSKVMIPLAFAASLGGITTLLGSSTNLLIAAKLSEMHYKNMHIFSFTLPGSIICCVGMIYVLCILPKLLPKRKSITTSLFRDKKNFLAEITINESSPLLKCRINDCLYDMRIRLLQRGDYVFFPPFRNDILLRKKDVIVITANKESLSNLMQNSKAVIINNAEYSKQRNQRDLYLSEVVVPPSSKFVNKSLNEIGCYSNYGIVVLGIQRRSQLLRESITRTRLKSGDVILLLAPHEQLKKISHSKDFILLESLHKEIVSPSKALKVNLIFIAVVALATLNILPILVSSFLGVVLLLLTKCMNIKTMLHALDSKVFFIITTAYMISIALDRTGIIAAIVHGITSISHNLHPLIIVAIVFFVIAFLNEVVSNNAMGLIFAPIALNLAYSLHIDERLFIWAVIFACGCAFSTPIGYQTNLLVMSAGNYKFSDYLKVGPALTVLVGITYLIFAYFYFNF